MLTIITAVIEFISKSLELIKLGFERKDASIISGPLLHGAENGERAKKLALAKLQRPPKSMLKVVRDERIERYRKNARNFALLAAGYISFTLLDVYLGYRLNIKSSGAENAVQLGNFLFGLGFAYRAFANHCSHRLVSAIAPVSRRTRLVRELIIKADYETLVDKCQQAFLKMRAPLLVADSADGEGYMRAQKARTRWGYVRDACPTEEIVVKVQSKGQDECAMRVEVTSDGEPEKAYFYALQFINLLFR
jgi:hypothetical protein